VCVDERESVWQTNWSLLLLFLSQLHSFEVKNQLEADGEENPGPAATQIGKM